MIFQYITSHPFETRTLFGFIWNCFTPYSPSLSLPACIPFGLMPDGNRADSSNYRTYFVGFVSFSFLRSVRSLLFIQMFIELCVDFPLALVLQRPLLGRFSGYPWHGHSQSWSRRRSRRSSSTCTIGLSNIDTDMCVSVCGVCGGERMCIGNWIYCLTFKVPLSQLRWKIGIKIFTSCLLHYASWCSRPPSNPKGNAIYMLMRLPDCVYRKRYIIPLRLAVEAEYGEKRGKKRERDLLPIQWKTNRLKMIRWSVNWTSASIRQTYRQLTLFGGETCKVARLTVHLTQLTAIRCRLSYFY